MRTKQQVSLKPHRISPEICLVLRRFAPDCSRVVAALAVVSVGAMMLPVGLAAKGHARGTEPAAEQSDSKSGVSIATGRTRYRVGEPIRVKIGNKLAVAIRAPADPRSCSVVMVEPLKEGVWIGEQVCPDEEECGVLRISPGSGITGALGRTGRTL